jgi:hypothetical protein
MPLTHPRESLANVYKFPGGTQGFYTLPKGHKILVDLLSMQRSADVYGEDAGVFRPGRWDVGGGKNGGEGESGDGVEAWMPFGNVEGSFSCPFHAMYVYFSTSCFIIFLSSLEFILLSV